MPGARDGVELHDLVFRIWPLSRYDFDGFLGQRRGMVVADFSLAG